MWKVRACVAAAWVAGVACGGDGSTGPSGPARVDVRPSGGITLDPGETVYITATVYDRNDHILVGQAVSYTSSAPGVASVSESGAVVAGAEPGEAHIVATVAGVNSAPYPVTVRNLHGVARTLVFADSTAASIGAGESDTIAVKVLDFYGAPVAGATVTFTGWPEGVVTPTVQTNGAGVATAVWRMSTALVQNTLDVASGGVGVQLVATPHAGPTVALSMAPTYVGLFGVASRDWNAGGVDAYGNTSSPLASVVSRDPAVATALMMPGFGATITAAPGARGSTFVVGTTADGVEDSVLVACAPDGGVIVGPGESRYAGVLPAVVDAGAVFAVPVWADAYVAIGSATIELTWDPAMLTYVDDAPHFSDLVVNRSEVTAGKLRVSFATGSQDGVVHQDAISVAFRAVGAAGRTGAIGYRVIEMTQAATFADLLPVAVAIPYSFRIR